MIEALKHILLIPGMTLQLGMLLATALLIGAMLLYEFRWITKIILALVLLLVFEEWVIASAALYWGDLDPQMRSLVPQLLIVITTLLFLSGLAMGAYIGFRQEQERLKELNQFERRLDALKNELKGGDDARD